MARTTKQISQHSGFATSEDHEALDQGASKAGKTYAFNRNVLASSTDVSDSPNSTATGEDVETDDTDEIVDVSDDFVIDDIEKESDEPFEENEDPPEERDLYGTPSDELELASALLEEATQSSASPRDPSTARYMIEEVDDDDRL
jgi:hypothetical protein